MGNCGSSIDCSDLYTPVAVDVNPDIVGIGVLASFFASIIITFLAVIYGFLNDYIPSEYLNEVDQAFLRRWHWCNRCRETIYSENTDSAPCHHLNAEVKAERRKGLEAFMLSMSDQQLITGLALMIATLAQRCSTCVYEYNVVASLAWLASSTHLSTLTILRKYFYEHKVVRDVRVFAIVINLILLLFISVTSSESFFVDSSITIQCVYQKPSFLLKQAYIDNPPANAIANGTTIIYLIYAYFNAICNLYYQDEYIPYYLALALLKKRFGSHWGSDEVKEWYREFNLQHHPAGEIQKGFQHDQARAIVLKKFSHWNHKERWTIIKMLRNDVFGRSFLAQITNLVFTISYGIAFVVVIRTQFKPATVTDSENTLDFGQLVPILLLTLPALTAMEIYYDTHTDANIDAIQKGLFGNLYHRKLQILPVKTSNQVPAQQETITTPRIGDETRLAGISNPIATRAEVENTSRSHSQNVSATMPTLASSDREVNIDELSQLSQDNVSKSAPINPYCNWPFMKFIEKLLMCSVIWNFGNGVILNLNSSIMLIFTVTVDIIIWLLSGIEDLRFYYSVFKEAKIRDLDTFPFKPTIGRRAPPPSIRVQSSTNLHPQDSLRDPNSGPRRRTTFEMADDTGGTEFANLVRVDTEADIGLLPIREVENN